MIDLETRSACDLKRHGGRRYAEDPSTSLLCAVALIGEDLYTWGPYPTGDASHSAEIPDAVAEAAASGFEFVAHNAFGFDAPVWDALGLPPAHWRDSADMARRHALPGSLDKLARYLLGECKDDSGARTLKRFMAPNKRTGKFLDPDPAAMRSILRYCVQDVLLLAKCCEVAGLLEPHVDDAVYEVHRHICERGVRVDVELAKTLIEADAQVKRIAVVSAGLPLTSLRSDKQFRQAVGKLGISIPDAQASTVRGLLGGPADSLARARLDVCTVTEGKAQGFLDRVESDGRIRGALTYYGAHTGRWSSRGVQLQNIPRPPAGFEPGDVEAVREGGFDAARHVAERIGCTVADVLSGCLRGIVMLDGCQVDLDQIEARVLAWLADDEKALAEFRAGKDPYAELASRMGVARGEAKVVTLACLAEGTPVLTDRGWVAIENVSAADKVWDGCEWVSHGGLVFKGFKHCVERSGVWLTPDHKILTSDGTWQPAGSCDRENCLPPGTYSENGQFWESRFMEVGISAPLIRELLGVRSPEHKPWLGAGSRRLPRRSVGATTPTPSSLRTTAHVGYGSANRGCGTGSNSCGISQPLSVGGTPSYSLTESTMIAATSRETCAWLRQPPTCGTPDDMLAGEPSLAVSAAPCGSGSATRVPVSVPSRARLDIRRVFDLLHVGPRNRFQAGPLIAHNCGYQGSVGALENWAQKFGLFMSRERMAELVEAWRDDRPAVAGRRNGGVFETAERAIPTRTGGLWKRYEKAAKKAIGGFTTVVGPVSFSKLGADLFAHLPSGRFIRYRNAAVEDVPESGRSIMYDHPRYGRISTYGGSICENLCQAIARDVMAEALLKIDAPMVLLVHDEVLAEGGLDEIHAALTTVPAWAPGLPLGAEGQEVTRYCK